MLRAANALIHPIKKSACSVVDIDRYRRYNSQEVYSKLGHTPERFTCQPRLDLLSRSPATNYRPYSLHKSTMFSLWPQIGDQLTFPVGLHIHKEAQ